MTEAEDAAVAIRALDRLKGEIELPGVMPCPRFHSCLMSVFIVKELLHVLNNLLQLSHLSRDYGFRKNRPMYTDMLKLFLH